MRRDSSRLRPRAVGVGTALALAVWVVAAFPQAAHAYIDPGSGALVLQAIVAGVAGAVFFFRDKFKAVLRRLGIGKEPPSLEEFPTTDPDESDPPE